MKIETKYMARKMMGRIVTVTKLIQYGTDEIREISIEKTKYRMARAGWIVGCTEAVAGEWKHEPERNRSYFKVNAKETVLLVCFWPNMKPVRVPIGGYMYGGVPMSPSKWAWVTMDPENREKERKFAKEMLSAVRRDEKGRFLPLYATIEVPAGSPVAPDPLDP